MLKHYFCFAALLSSLTASAQFGVLDNTFGTGGKVSTAVAAGNTSDYATSMFIQPDQKIVAAGHTDYDFSVVRYNPDGTLDNTFDADGMVIIDFGADVYYVAKCVPMQSDKILVIGSGYGASGGDIFAIRLNADGSLDNSFDSDGKATYDIGSNTAYASDAFVHWNNSVYIVGSSYASASDFLVLKINSDGSLDNTFDSDGMLTIDINIVDDVANDIDTTSAGRLVIAGYSGTGSSNDFAMVCLNTDGSLYSSFGSSGKVVTPIGSLDDRAIMLDVLANKKIVLAGKAHNGTNYDAAIAFYNSDGTIDNGFDSDGKVMVDVAAKYDEFRSVLEQPDGKILLCGSTRKADDTDDFLLMRFTTSGTTDNTFGTNGMVLTDFASDDDVAISIGLNSDGTIIAAGGRYTSSNQDYALAKYSSGLTSFQASYIAEGSFSAYPNPGSQKIHLNYSLVSETQISIFLRSCDGSSTVSLMENAARNRGEHHETIAISDELPAGLYLLEIQAEEHTKHLKYVKMQ